jgi:DNA-directed RNA polymerase specialized sigma24 family protein
VSVDRKRFLSDPALLGALGAHIRARVPASDADDVLQSVLADALAAEGAPDDEGAMRRWLYGVARNKVADFYRRAKREVPSDLVDDAAAPSSNRGADDLLRWAEAELPPGSDAKRTLEWMLREGAGEKLEAIAASEKLPAPRVRKRVSRMREHFRARWAAYVAALAAAGLAIFIVFYIFRRKPEPQAHIVPETPSSVPRLVPALSVSVPPSASAPPSATAPPSASAPPIPTLSTRPAPTPVPLTTSTAPRTPVRSETSGSSF